MRDCPDCNGRWNIIAPILEPAAIKTILTYLGLPDKPPGLAPSQIRARKAKGQATKNDLNAELGSPILIHYMTFSILKAKHQPASTSISSKIPVISVTSPWICRFANMSAGLCEGTSNARSL